MQQGIINYIILEIKGDSETFHLVVLGVEREKDQNQLGRQIYTIYINIQAFINRLHMFTNM